MPLKFEAKPWRHKRPFAAQNHFAQNNFKANVFVTRLINTQPYFERDF